MGVKGGLNHKTRQDILKITRRHYHLQKIRCSIHEYKFIFLKENIKNHYRLPDVFRSTQTSGSARPFCIINSPTWKFLASVLIFKFFIKIWIR